METFELEKQIKQNKNDMYFIFCYTYILKFKLKQTKYQSFIKIIPFFIAKVMKNKK